MDSRILVDGYPASEVALVSVAGLALSGSNVTSAVFFSKSTLTLVTPGTFSSAFLTMIGQSAQVIFFTSRVTVSKVPANRVKGSAAKTLTRKKTVRKRFHSE